MKTSNYVFTFFLVLMAGILLSFCKSGTNDAVESKENPTVLVFSKTAGFRHDSI